MSDRRRRATAAPQADSIWLAAYFAGGVVLGALFDRFGWPACVAGIGGALAVACVLAVGLTRPAARAMTHAA